MSSNLSTSDKPKENFFEFNVPESSGSAKPSSIVLTGLEKESFPSNIALPTTLSLDLVDQIASIPLPQTIEAHLLSQSSKMLIIDHLTTTVPFHIPLGSQFRKNFFGKYHLLNPKSPKFDASRYQKILQNRENLINDLCPEITTEEKDGLKNGLDKLLGSALFKRDNANNDLFLKLDFEPYKLLGYLSTIAKPKKDSLLTSIGGDVREVTTPDIKDYLSKQIASHEDTDLKEILSTTPDWDIVCEPLLSENWSDACFEIQDLSVALQNWLLIPYKIIHNDDPNILFWLRYFTQSVTGCAVQIFSDPSGNNCINLSFGNPNVRRLDLTLKLSQTIKHLSNLDAAFYSLDAILEELNKPPLNISTHQQKISLCQKIKVPLQTHAPFSFASFACGWAGQKLDVPSILYPRIDEKIFVKYIGYFTKGISCDNKDTFKTSLHHFRPIRLAKAVQSFNFTHQSGDPLKGFLLILNLLSTLDSYGYEFISDVFNEICVICTSNQDELLAYNEMKRRHLDNDKIEFIVRKKTLYLDYLLYNIPNNSQVSPIIHALRYLDVQECLSILQTTLFIDLQANPSSKTLRLSTHLGASIEVRKPFHFFTSYNPAESGEKLPQDLFDENKVFYSNFIYSQLSSAKFDPEILPIATSENFKGDVDWKTLFIKTKKLCESSLLGNQLLGYFLVLTVQTRFPLEEAEKFLLNNLDQIIRFFKAEDPKLLELLQSLLRITDKTLCEEKLNTLLTSEYRKIIFEALIGSLENNSVNRKFIAETTPQILFDCTQDSGKKQKLLSVLEKRFNLSSTVYSKKIAESVLEEHHLHLNWASHWRANNPKDVTTLTTVLEDLINKDLADSETLETIIDLGNAGLKLFLKLQKTNFFEVHQISEIDAFNRITTSATEILRLEKCAKKLVENSSVDKSSPEKQPNLNFSESAVQACSATFATIATVMRQDRLVLKTVSEDFLAKAEGCGLIDFNHPDIQTFALIDLEKEWSIQSLRYLLPILRCLNSKKELALHHLIFKQDLSEDTFNQILTLIREGVIKTYSSELNTYIQSILLKLAETENNLEKTYDLYVELSTLTLYQNHPAIEKKDFLRILYKKIDASQNAWLKNEALPAIKALLTTSQTKEEKLVDLIALDLKEAMQYLKGILEKKELTDWMLVVIFLDQLKDYSDLDEADMTILASFINHYLSSCTSSKAKKTKTTKANTSPKALPSLVSFIEHYIPIDAIQSLKIVNLAENQKFITVQNKKDLSQKLIELKITSFESTLFEITFTLESSSNSLSTTYTPEQTKDPLQGAIDDLKPILGCQEMSVEAGKRFVKALQLATKTANPIFLKSLLTEIIEPLLQKKWVTFETNDPLLIDILDKLRLVDVDSAYAIFLRLQRFVSLENLLFKFYCQYVSLEKTTKAEEILSKQCPKKELLEYSKFIEKVQKTDVKNVYETFIFIFKTLTSPLSRFSLILEYLEQGYYTELDPDTLKKLIDLFSQELQKTGAKHLSPHIKFNELIEWLAPIDPVSSVKLIETCHSLKILENNSKSQTFVNVLTAFKSSDALLFKDFWLRHHNNFLAIQNDETLFEFLVEAYLFLLLHPEENSNEFKKVLAEDLIASSFSKPRTKKPQLTTPFKIKKSIFGRLKKAFNETAAEAAESSGVRSFPISLVMDPLIEHNLGSRFGVKAIDLIDENNLCSEDSIKILEHILNKHLFDNFSKEKLFEFYELLRKYFKKVKEAKGLPNENLVKSLNNAFFPLIAEIKKHESNDEGAFKAVILASFVQGIPYSPTSEQAHENLHWMCDFLIHRSPNRKNPKVWDLIDHLFAKFAPVQENFSSDATHSIHRLCKDFVILTASEKPDWAIKYLESLFNYFNQILFLDSGEKTGEVLGWLDDSLGQYLITVFPENSAHYVNLLLSYSSSPSLKVYEIMETKSLAVAETIFNDRPLEATDLILSYPVKDVKRKIFVNKLIDKLSENLSENVAYILTLIDTYGLFGPRLLEAIPDYISCICDEENLQKIDRLFNRGLEQRLYEGRQEEHLAHFIRLHKAHKEHTILLSSNVPFLDPQVFIASQFEAAKRLEAFETWVNYFSIFSEINKEFISALKNHVEVLEEKVKELDSNQHIYRKQLIELQTYLNKVLIDAILKYTPSVYSDSLYITDLSLAFRRFQEIDLSSKEEEDFAAALFDKMLEVLSGTQVHLSGYMTVDDLQLMLSSPPKIDLEMNLKALIDLYWKRLNKDKVLEGLITKGKPSLVDLAAGLLFRYIETFQPNEQKILNDKEKIFQLEEHLRILISKINSNAKTLSPSIEKILLSKGFISCIVLNTGLDVEAATKIQASLMMEFIEAHFGSKNDVSLDQMEMYIPFLEKSDPHFDSLVHFMVGRMLTTIGLAKINQDLCVIFVEFLRLVDLYHHKTLKPHKDFYLKSPAEGGVSEAYVTALTSFTNPESDFQNLEVINETANLECNVNSLLYILKAFCCSKQDFSAEKDANVYFILNLIEFFIRIYLKTNVSKTLQQSKNIQNICLSFVTSKLWRHTALAAKTQNLRHPHQKRFYSFVKSQNRDKVLEEALEVYVVPNSGYTEKHKNGLTLLISHMSSSEDIVNLQQTIHYCAAFSAWYDDAFLLSNIEKVCEKLTPCAFVFTENSQGFIEPLLSVFIRDVMFHLNEKPIGPKVLFKIIQYYFELNFEKIKEFSAVDLALTMDQIVKTIRQTFESYFDKRNSLESKSKSKMTPEIRSAKMPILDFYKSMSCLITSLNKYSEVLLKKGSLINPEAFGISSFFDFDKKKNISSKLTAEEKKARAKTILDWYKLLTDLQSELACEIAERDSKEFRYMLEGVDKSILETYAGPFMQIKHN